MSEHVIATNETDFEEDVLQAKFALVDFWAEWCGPCKMIAPIFEDVAKEYAEKVNFVKVDVDKNPTIAGQYDVRGIPALILFKAGQVCATSVGSLTKTQLINFLEENL